MSFGVFRSCVLTSLVIVGIGGDGWANNPQVVTPSDLSRIARPPAAAANPVIGKPIAMKTMLGVKLDPQSQTVRVDQPAVYTVNIAAISVSSPIALSGTTSSGRVLQFSPNPVQPGAKAQLTLPVSDSDGSGTYTVSVHASAGDVAADSAPAALVLTDPPCGSEPPKLVMTFPKVTFSPMVGNKAGPATFHVRVVNQGGRLPPNPTLRIMGIGSNCQNGHCLQGPGKPGANVPSDNDFAGRGGCARLVYEGDVPGQSLIPATDCGVGSTMSKVINGSGYIPGLIGGGLAGVATTVTCAQMTKTP